MNKLSICMLLVLGVSAASVARADSAGIATLFASEADVITPAGDGALVALELGPEVLAHVKPDLSDVRIFDGAGREVPYLVDGNGRPAAFRVFKRIEGRVLKVERSKVGYADEHYVLAVPPEVTARGTWTLALQTSDPDFVRSIALELIENGATTVSQHGSSVYRTANGAVERLRIPLDALYGRSGELRVSITGTGHRYLEPTFAFESSELTTTATEIHLPLEILSTTSHDHETNMVLDRPTGVVPNALIFESSTPLFDRQVFVADRATDGKRVPLGADRIFRVEGVSSLEVPVSAATGTGLLVDVRNLDSPPLENLRVMVQVDAPRLLFAPPVGGDASATLILRFGGGRARRPVYDLSGLVELLETPHGEAAAMTLVGFLDPSRVRLGTLGPSRSNPSFAPKPPLAALMKAGPAVEESFYDHVRSVAATSSTDGSYHFRLNPEDQAAARPDLADLRVVDMQNRQWPYVIDRESPPEWAHVVVTRLGTNDGVSEYALTGAATTEPNAIELAIEDPLFDRAFEVIGQTVEGKAVTLATGRLSRGAEEGDKPLIIEMQSHRVASLVLRVTDGSNASLHVVGARARTESPILYFVAPPGMYRLLLGNPKDTAPVYDLERMRDVLFAAQSAEAEVTMLVPNPRFSQRARLLSKDEQSSTLLWAVLGFAVLVLGALTLRIARKEA